MAVRPIRIGTRGSRLALWQADTVIRLLRDRFPSREFQQVIISTMGDRNVTPPLSSFGGVGVFTKEIEAALIEDRIDLAVHSLKDLPTIHPDGLRVCAVMRREDPRDAFVGKAARSLRELPEGARIGTSSVRRRAQLLFRRPDLHVTSIRGNVPTRLRKLNDPEENLDGIILAVAGLLRLGYTDLNEERLPYDVMVPAPGQGAVAVESRSSDKESIGMARLAAHDEQTYRCVSAERALLRRFGGGCHVPLGALAEIDGDELTLRAVVAAPDGSTMLSRMRSCPADLGVELGEQLAEELIEEGGHALLSDGLEAN
jgi:hydroxymethylbilane synthase